MAERISSADHIFYFMVKEFGIPVVLPAGGEVNERKDVIDESALARGIETSYPLNIVSGDLSSM